jgi:hypothetical protein
MTSVALDIQPFGVGIAAVIFFMGGLLRMVYALMFESAEPGAPTLEGKVLAGAAAFKSTQSGQPALPSKMSITVDNYVSPASGNWRNTSELEPRSVTEGTTKLFTKKSADQ